jgi:hypothetical protein
MKFHLSAKEVAAVCALVTPVLVPSNLRAAASAAASEYACPSFFAIYILPMSTASPKQPKMTTADMALTTNTKPSLRRFDLFLSDRTFTPFRACRPLFSFFAVLLFNSFMGSL